MMKPTEAPMNDPTITTVRTNNVLTCLSSNIAIVGSAGMG